MEVLLDQSMKTLKILEFLWNTGIFAPVKIVLIDTYCVKGTTRIETSLY